MTYNQKDIWTIELPSSDISWSDEFHWREVALFEGYTWTEFNQLSGPEQSGLVAHYETRLRLDSVIAHNRPRKRRRLRDASHEQARTAFALRAEAVSGQRNPANEASVASE